MKKMGRKLIIGTAMAVSAVSVTACRPAGSLYGPPPNVPTSPEKETTTFETFLEETENTTLAEEIESQIESIIESTYDPEDNIAVGVYGPPPDETFDPADEINEDVYGPPGDF